MTAVISHLKQERERSIHDVILRAALRSYKLHGQRAVPYWEFLPAGGSDPIPDLVVPDLRRVEEVETAETLLALDKKKFDRYRDAGMEVWVLVPLEEMAVAHQKLRGLVSRIQGYWFVSNEPRFGPPEHP